MWLMVSVLEMTGAEECSATTRCRQYPVTLLICLLPMSILVFFCFASPCTLFMIDIDSPWFVNFVFALLRLNEKKCHE